MTSIETRLTTLEHSAKTMQAGEIWVEMKNNMVRVDTSKPGTPRTFTNTHEAARWLEKRIDRAPVAFGSIHVKNLCDVYPKSDDLRAAVSDVFGPDDLPAFVFGDLKPGDHTDLNLWLLANVLKSHKVLDQVKADLNKEILLKIDAFYKIFTWDRSATFDELAALIVQTGGL